MAKTLYFRSFPPDEAEYQEAVLRCYASQVEKDPIKLYKRARNRFPDFVLDFETFEKRIKNLRESNTEIKMVRDNLLRKRMENKELLREIKEKEKEIIEDMSDEEYSECIGKLPEYLTRIGGLHA